MLETGKKSNKVNLEAAGIKKVKKHTGTSTSRNLLKKLKIADT